jgi:hypothetical protein
MYEVIILIIYYYYIINLDASTEKGINNLKKFTGRICSEDNTF